QQRSDQRRLAADAVPVMPENRSPDRAGGKANEIRTVGEKGGRQRILVGEEELAEDETGCGAVEEKVVPLDRGADRRGDDRPAQLRAVLGFRQRHRCCGHDVLPIEALTNVRWPRPHFRRMVILLQRESSLYRAEEIALTELHAILSQQRIG